MLLFLREIWIGLDSRPVEPMALQKCDLRSESHPEPCWSHFVPLPIAAPRNASLKDADINLHCINFFTSYTALPEWLKTFELKSAAQMAKKRQLSQLSILKELKTFVSPVPPTPCFPRQLFKGLWVFRSSTQVLRLCWDDEISCIHTLC